MEVRMLKAILLTSGRPLLTFAAPQPHHIFKDGLMLIW